MQGPSLAHKRSSRRAEAQPVTLSRPNYGGPRSRTARRSRCHAVCKKESAQAFPIQCHMRSSSGAIGRAETMGTIRRRNRIQRQEQGTRTRLSVEGEAFLSPMMNAITEHEAQPLRLLLFPVTLGLVNSCSRESEDGRQRRKDRRWLCACRLPRVLVMAAGSDVSRPLRPPRKRSLGVTPS